MCPDFKKTLLGTLRNLKKKRKGVFFFSMNTCIWQIIWNTITFLWSKGDKVLGVKESFIFVFVSIGYKNQED